MNSDLATNEQLLEARIKKQLCARAIIDHERQIAEVNEQISACEALLASRPPPPQAHVAEMFAHLPWQVRNKDPNFSWVFNTGRDGAQLSETAEMAKLIADHDGKLEVQGFEFTLSENRKFLQRRKLHN
jgi:hypothetical protein